MTDRRTVVAIISVAAGLTSGCIRGSLPAREFYRLAPPDSVPSSRQAASPPLLSGPITIAPFDTPGIYGSGGIVYRTGLTHYGVYPSREWAVPLGEMLAALSERVLRRSGLTTGEVLAAARATRAGEYQWRGSVREFDEVDGPTSVAVSVALAAQLIRTVDDSLVWTGVAHAEEPVHESRSMDAVVRALSVAAARAMAALADEAADAVRRLTAAGAQGR